MAAATTRGVTLAALMSALGRPAWWVLALAGFLVRGGVVLFLVAIVSLPSPLALSNVLAPIVTPIYFGQIEPGTAALIALTVGGLIAWLIGGSWLAAATEVVLVRDARAVAAEEGLPVAAAQGAGRFLITRAAAAHLVSLLPLAFALGFGSIAILNVAYRELVNPSDSSPVVPRIIIGALLPVAVIVVLWIVGEIVGGNAVRRVVLLDEPVLVAVGRSVAGVVRHPIGGLIAPLVTIGVMGLDLLAVLLVVAIVWTDIRDRLVHPIDDPVAASLALMTFAGAWCLALVVTGLVASWRSVAMSFEIEREAAATP